MAELLHDRASFDSAESFTADNGITYHRVDYSGAAGTGYLSERSPGVYYKITEGYYKDKKREDEDEPPRKEMERITATLDVETQTTNGFGVRDTCRTDIEITGYFYPYDSPTDGEVRSKMNELAGKAREQMPFVEGDVNISRQRVRAVLELDPGWAFGELSVDFEKGGSYSYDIDPEQTTIQDF